MTAKKKLVEEIIKSLKENYSDWIFGDYTAKNTKTGVEIWIANMPVIDLMIYRPTKINFGLIDKFRIYKALDECRSLQLISLL